MNKIYITYVYDYLKESNENVYLYDDIPDNIFNELKIKKNVDSNKFINIPEFDILYLSKKINNYIAVKCISSPFMYINDLTNFYYIFIHTDIQYGNVFFCGTYDKKMNNYLHTDDNFHYVNISNIVYINLRFNEKITPNHNSKEENIVPQSKDFSNNTKVVEEYKKLLEEYKYVFNNYINNDEINLLNSKLCSLNEKIYDLLCKNEKLKKQVDSLNDENDKLFDINDDLKKEINKLKKPNNLVIHNYF